ncbi:MAG TPA: SDR family oxidoreductase [Gammaproteobacteria bacterium]|jgi:nucleoside-diphosphate-sugar epimerase|nr:SDR family oxidoreductase [Gammaproteobacteria bacterium]
MDGNTQSGVLIIGCGDTGRRLAGLYGAEGRQVTGVVRSEASQRALLAAGIRPIRCDLDAGDLPSLPSGGAKLFYFAPPVDVGKDDVRIERLLEHLELTGLPSRFLYMSTTGVYGDCEGRWIDEDEPLKPSTYRAQRRIAAEQAVQRWCTEHGIPWTILRVPAIYGPGRLLTERLKSGMPTVRPEECSFTNRIHIDDLVAVCHAAMAHAPGSSVYNVSDGHPSTITDYLFLLADLTGMPKPPLITMQEAERMLSPSIMSFLKESKRIRNDKLLREIGLTLRYPDLQSGLKASLATA